MRQDSRMPFYLILLFSYVVIGAVVLTVNTAMPTVAAEYGWNDAQGGLLITFLSVGNMIASLLTGVVAVRFGIRRTLIGCALALVVSNVGFATLGQPTLFYPMMLLAGIGWGGVNNLVNTCVSLMYGGGGFGSAVIPVLAGAISDAVGMRMGMLSLCGFLAVFVVFSVISLSLSRGEQAIHS